MKYEINIEERKPIWIALSDFYVDTELQDSDYKHIASIFKKSPYSLKEIKQIDKEEVFPILHHNLLAVAGIWTGFQEEWLVNKITKKIQNRTAFSRLINRIVYWFFKSMKEPWGKLEQAYQNLNS